MVRDGCIYFTQTKTTNSGNAKLVIPIARELQAVIDASPSGDMTFLINQLGRPFTAAGFGNKFREWCDQAGLPHCSSHGLRKAMSALLAERGATENQIMSITGHTTLQEVSRYTKAARQKVLAASAMKLIDGTDHE